MAIPAPLLGLRNPSTKASSFKRLWLQKRLKRTDIQPDLDLNNFRHETLFSKNLHWGAIDEDCQAKSYIQERMGNLSLDLCAFTWALLSVIVIQIQERGL